MWLDQLPPGRGAGGDYAQLLEAICLALELPAGPAEVSLFNFPMTDLPQVGRGVAAARDALQGYLERRIEQLRPRAVVLLGEIEEPWFNRSCLEHCPVLVTVSAWRMLRQPDLKPVAWSDLQSLRGHGS
jgi:uracil-DNA glycosylase